MPNDHHSKEIYQQLEIESYHEKTTLSGKSKLTIHERKHPISALSIIEQFVDEINQSNDLAFDIHTSIENKVHIQNRNLEKHYCNINECFDAYNDSYTYCPKVAIFYEACIHLNLSPGWVSFGSPSDICLSDGETTYAHLFNRLILHVRLHCQTNSYRRRLQQHKRNVLRRTAKAFFWESEMFLWRSRHQILSLTLSYKEQFRSTITLEAVQDHLKRLLNNRRNNHLLHGIDGYVWKIEEGMSVGLHVHILIAYSPEAKQDIVVAEKIGQYWETFVTDGMGQYWNSNKGKNSYASYGHGLGVGSINHYDTEKREALKKNLGYLMKSDQYLKQKSCAKTRVVAMSQIPKKSNAGRPRNRDL